MPDMTLNEAERRLRGLQATCLEAAPLVASLAESIERVQHGLASVAESGWMTGEQMRSARQLANSIEAELREEAERIPILAFMIEEMAG